MEFEFLFIFILLSDSVYSYYYGSKYTAEETTALEAEIINARTTMDLIEFNDILPDGATCTKAGYFNFASANTVTLNRDGNVGFRTLRTQKTTIRHVKVVCCGLASARTRRTMCFRPITKTSPWISFWEFENDLDSIELYSVLSAPPPRRRFSIPAHLQHSPAPDLEQVQLSSAPHTISEMEQVQQVSSTHSAPSKPKPSRLAYAASTFSEPERIQFFSDSSTFPELESPRLSFAPPPLHSSELEQVKLFSAPSSSKDESPRIIFPPHPPLTYLELEQMQLSAPSTSSNPKSPKHSSTLRLLESDQIKLSPASSTSSISPPSELEQE